MPVDQVRLEGIDDLRRALKRAGASLADLKDANERAGRLVATEASDLAPRRTGRLVQSIRPARQVAKAVVRAGGVGVPYAGPIHFGWPAHNIEPQPFLYDAIDRRRADVI